MKDFFKKFSKPQTEVEDLDSGYDSEYYAGSYEKEDRRGEDQRPEDDRFDRFDRGDNGYYAPRGFYEEQDAPSYRERVEEPVAEPIFTPEPAPEYLYFTPATYRDCREGIVKGLAAGHVVVVRLGDLEANDVLRLFDYMMGAVLALDAELIRPEATTVVLVPDGVELDEDELELDDEEEYDEDEEYEDEEYDEDEEYEEGEYEEYDEDEEYEEDETAEEEYEEYEEDEYEEYDENGEYEEVDEDAE